MRIFLICWQHLQDAAPNNSGNTNHIYNNLLKQQQLQLQQQQQQQMQQQLQLQQQQAPLEPSLNVEAVILQNQVDTLHWQLKQVSYTLPSLPDPPPPQYLHVTKDLGRKPCSRPNTQTCDMRLADESWLDAAHFERLELCKVSDPLPLSHLNCCRSKFHQLQPVSLSCIPY